jgi:hypothetical protein
MVRVRLSDDRYAWLCDAAAEHKPPLGADELLRQLVDLAIAEGKAAVLRRAEQFEIYRASGYAEHHPDYPDFPGDSLTSRRPDDSLEEIERPGLRSPAEP